MVESGQRAIEPVDFESRVHSKLPVEVIESGYVLSLHDESRLPVAQRPSFHLFLLMRSDRGSHTVDFAKIPARDGRLVQVRPGQVQVWDPGIGPDATIALARPATSSALPWFPGDPSFCDLDRVSMQIAEAIIECLRSEQARFDGSEPSARLMTSLFESLVALFDLASAGSGDAELPQVYLDFRTAIEATLDHQLDVVDYARELGYSARTLSRACRLASGQTAKQILNDRFVLEAKRLLVHTTMTAASISSQLGFSEPTNFTKFFSRNTDMSPTDFRKLHRTGRAQTAGPTRTAALR